MNDKRNGLRLTIPTMKIVAPPHDCSEIKSRLASLLATSMNPASHKQRLARTESAIPSNASCDGMADLSREEFPPVEKSGDVIPAGYRIRRRPVVLQPDPLFLAIGGIPAFPPLHHSNPPAAYIIRDTCSRDFLSRVLQFFISCRCSPTSFAGWEFRHPAR